MKPGVVVAGLAGGAALTWGAIRAARTMREDLRGKVAVVTGGSRGLGLQIAKRLVKEGCEVVIVARDRDGLRSARRLLHKEGGEVHTIAVDVADRDAVERMAQEVRERHGGIDILVNNASVIQVGPVESMDIEDFRHAMGVNYWGTVHTCFAFLDDLKARKGRIVNVDSIGGRIAAPHLLPYAAAKFATYGFSEGLGIELAKSGVTVTTVVPGFMRTGSPVNAMFKGDAAREFAWFAAGDATPLTSMQVERAARSLVGAMKRRDTVVVIGMQARLMRLAHDLMPGVTPRLARIVDRALPRADGQTRGRYGWEVAGEAPARTSARLIEPHAERHQQFDEPRQARRAARLRRA